MLPLTPATQRTMYFIGVTTGKSSIMKVFPAWAEHLNLNAVMRGIDFPPSDTPENYARAVDFIKGDSLSLGGLITTHKVNLLKAARDRFSELDPYAQTLNEISSISKRGSRLIGHAKDPISAGAAFESIVPEGHWKRTAATLCLLGSGGSSLALTLYLHNKAKSRGQVPANIIVTARRDESLVEMKDIHSKIGFSIPIRYALAPTPGEADAVVEQLPEGSMVVNATGLGKDRPGSPLTDDVCFPMNGLMWEFNYRGDLLFLDQARAKKNDRNLTIEDGWVYFVHGWTRVIAEVFDINIPSAGPKFNTLSQIALKAAA